MTAREMEIIEETEIFTEALVASVAVGEITVFCRACAYSQ
jgi:hypothetical protein